MRKGAEKLSKAIGRKQQGRLDGYFTTEPKRKAEEGDTAKANKKGKGTGAHKGKAGGSKKK